MGPSGADRTQVGPMLAPWTLLSGCILLALCEENRNGDLCIHLLKGQLCERGFHVTTWSHWIISKVNCRSHYLEIDKWTKCVLCWINETNRKVVAIYIQIDLWTKCVLHQISVNSKVLANKIRHCKCNTPKIGSNIANMIWEHIIWSCFFNVPKGTKPLPEPMLTYPQWKSLAFSYKQHQMDCSRTNS